MDKIININDEGGPELKRLMELVKHPQPLHQSIAIHVERITRDYIRAGAGSRHHTAERLGAEPTNFYGAEVGESVRGHGEPDAAIISMHPAMKRAFSDVLIWALNSTYLTLPISALSYGQRIKKGKGSRFKGFFFTSKKGNLLYAMRGADAQLILLYLLKKSVKQPQDRTLLPPDNQIKAAAIAGAIKSFDDEFKKWGKQ